MHPTVLACEKCVDEQQGVERECTADGNGLRQQLDEERNAA